MADVYIPTTPATGFANISAFVADANGISAATKTALNLALANISGLMGVGGVVGAGIDAASPDFNKIPPELRFLLQNELAVLVAAVTAHA